MEAPIKPFLVNEKAACLVKVARFNYCYTIKHFDECIDMLQSLEFCADYCEYISNITEPELSNCGSATWLDLLIFDKDFFANYSLEMYYHKAANFFGFKHVGHYNNQPVCYQNSFYDCAWRVPHPNPLPNIDNPYINGNAYMIDPQKVKPLHYFLNEWAKCLKNKSRPKF